ncbi:Hypothetical predicted protein [Octopus vulgaris]|uniref:Uncharacterized protein n=1 Tax=Octopus vulgaris TaxID=6645 RepID=A0AA36FDE6_OCTVU|nr:Hypothetical predicted protein [Octopus vulgaris]
MLSKAQSKCEDIEEHYIKIFVFRKETSLVDVHVEQGKIFEKVRRKCWLSRTSGGCGKVSCGKVSCGGGSGGSDDDQFLKLFNYFNITLYSIKDYTDIHVHEDVPHTI